ncbi:MAG: tRNA (adenosine(37)-N6)-threonylcarbamoyltransferase complex dimerization subunit type 1 TsaB [Deltaproteobacteria bacterium]|nr:MAG: tRNA (adenosine(37)-N6)-threonylcarbamoyltransferase complex dimerization subunit type 1 TsaB [Deltaproteobacteria bacterium]
MNDNFYWLVVDTSFKESLVVIAEGENILLEVKVIQTFKSSENLIYYIKYLLLSIDMDFRKINGIAIGLGPGSYTGIRIGLAAVKGVAFPDRIPILGFNSFEGIAGNGAGYVAVPATKNQYYLWRAGSQECPIITSALPDNVYIERVGLKGSVIVKKIPKIIEKRDRYISFRS